MSETDQTSRRSHGQLLAPPRWLTVVPGVVVLLLVGVLVAVFMPGVRHEYALWQLRCALVELKHPTGTTEIRTASAVGLLSGNGNHCDFVVYQVRAGDLTQSELASAYEHNRVREAELEVYVVRDGAVVDSTGEDPDLDRVGLSVSDVARGYVVGLLRYGQDPEGDIRCH